MKIGITLADQSFARTQSLGIYNVSIGLVEGLAHHSGVSELTVLINGEMDPEAVFDRTVFCSKVRFRKTLERAPAHLRRILWDQALVAASLDQTGCDWSVFPKGFPPLARWPHSKVCCYVHDDIFGFYQRQRLPGKSPVERFYFPAALRRALRLSDLVITNSRFSESEVKAAGREAPIACVGVGFNDVPELLPQEPDSILLLVSPYPHKLTAQAIDWVQRWKESRKSRLLVHGVGSLPAGVQWPEDPDWLLLGRLDHDQFEALWARTAVLLYFSVYEGYGMPPLEAAVRGVRTLASDLPPHRENLPASLLFNNSRWEDFTEKLDAVLDVPDHAVFNAKVDSWEEVADRVVTAMQAASGARP